jgi:hypothetical protein
MLRVWFSMHNFFSDRVIKRSAQRLVYGMCDPARRIHHYICIEPADRFTTTFKRKRFYYLKKFFLRIAIIYLKLKLVSYEDLSKNNYAYCGNFYFICFFWPAVES